MAEAYETEEKKPDFQRYLDIARRRHMYFLVPLLFGWVLVWGLSWILPPRYKSTTLILVEEPSGPKAIAGADFGDSLQQRLQNMQQQILSRTRLLMIIDSMHLYGGGHKPLTDDEKVTKMRKEITIDLVRDAQNAGVTGFKIDYASGDAHVAQKVTGELAGLFISENQRNIIQQSGDTTKFLKAQLDAAAALLAEQEAKVNNF